MLFITSARQGEDPATSLAGGLFAVAAAVGGLPGRASRLF
jgi:hypothetical protein